MNEPKKSAPWSRVLLRWLLILLGGYLGLCFVLFVLQRRYLYFPSAEDGPLPGEKRFSGMEDVTLKTQDGLRIRAWYWPGNRPATLVIFHGNAGSRFGRRHWMADLHGLGYGVFLLDYRGYGGSEGSPSEEGLYLDAEAAIRWLGERAAGKLVYLGESLGSGVAVEMAVRHPPAAIILQSAYTSMVDVGRRHYFYIPVNQFLKDRFDSAKKIGHVTCPVLSIHGKKDRIVPTDLGVKLHEKAPEPKELLLIDDVGHNDLLFAWPIYYQAVESFLEKHVGKGEG